MRKIRPQDVRQDFATLVAERVAHFQRVEAGLRGSQHEKRDVSILSETTLHGVYVAFECFLSDLFLAYMNRDFSQYQNTLSAKIANSTRDRFGAWAQARISFTAVAHMSVDRIEALIDPDSYNLTFKNVESLKQKANEWIAAPFRNAIAGLNDSDTHLIDAVHAIRNFVAHQSPSAKDRMNEELSTVVTGPGCPNLHLGRGTNDIHDVGSFLKTNAGGQRRVLRCVQRLGAIAATL